MKKYSVQPCKPGDVPPDALWVTRCSKRKSCLTEDVPRKIYTSPQNQKFYKWAEKSCIPYGTISDLYGLVLNDQAIKTYDLAPSKESVVLRVLGEIVGAKCRWLGWESIIFFCKDYEEAKPYLRILSFSGLKAYWIQELPK